MQQEPWEPLAGVLAPHVEKLFDELPEALQGRIKQRGGWVARRDYWNTLAPKQRQILAQQSDDHSNPALQDAPESIADFFIGFWEPHTPEGKGRVRHWLKRRSVNASKAARLMCCDDPIENPQEKLSTPANPAFELLLNTFSDAEQDGRSRNLNAWIAIAQADGLGHLASVSDWAACSVVFANESKPAAQESARVFHPVALDSRLLPRTAWRGGRIRSIDLLTLQEAATQASEHAGKTISVNDFLRAGARGEIRIHSILNRQAKTRPTAAGALLLNEGRPMPAGALCHLPVNACQQLAVNRSATWRTIEDTEEIDGLPCCNAKWELTPDEPDFETSLDDCRITGRDVHALADACAPEEGSPSTDGPQAAPKSAETAPKTNKPPMSRAGLVRAHQAQWPTIETDLNKASENGLAAAAKCGVRGWDEAAALEWARSKGKLHSSATTAPRAGPFDGLGSGRVNRIKG